MLIRIISPKHAFVQKAFSVPDVIAYFRLFMRGGQRSVLYFNGKNFVRKRTFIIRNKQNTFQRLLSDSALYDSHEARSVFGFKPHSLHFAIALYSLSSINKHFPSRELPALRLYRT